MKKKNRMETEVDIERDRRREVKEEGNQKAKKKNAERKKTIKGIRKKCKRRK
jgi:hypothetical protein